VDLIALDIWQVPKDISKMEKKYSVMSGRKENPVIIPR